MVTHAELGSIHGAGSEGAFTSLPREEASIESHAGCGNHRLPFGLFRPDEDWPMFQRAFYAAQALGVVDKTHDAMFDAVWKTGELAISDPNTHQLKTPFPSIEDAAKFYQRVAGIKPETFLATAKSFSVASKGGVSHG